MKHRKMSIVDRARSAMHSISHRHYFAERQGVGAMFVCSRRIGPMEAYLMVSPADGGNDIELFDVIPQVIAELGQCGDPFDLRLVAENLALSYR